VIAIKQDLGYLGGVCQIGSPEYVRFYLSFDGGVTWIDQGASSFFAHDSSITEPIEYDVTLEIDPEQSICILAELPRVRAILAWNDLPPTNTPDFSPIWGNVKEATIQIEPAKFFLLDKVAAELKLPAGAVEKLASIVDAGQELQADKKPTLGAVQLHALYKGKVPAHRYLFPEVAAIVNKPIASEALVASSGYLSKLGIDLSKAISELVALDGDTSFEQLDCVGYNIDLSEVVATLTVKQPAGYSGGLCYPGSAEYVSFWVDWGGGTGWSFIGTTAVQVHDIATLPPGGIQYAASLHWDPADHRHVCEQGINVAKIRATLSWATPATDPNVPPTWGNHLDVDVQIRPGEKVNPGDFPPSIESVGGMVPMTQIGAATGRANGTSIISGYATHDSPFGDLVKIRGSIANSAFGASVNLRYRVAVLADSAALWEELQTSFTLYTRNPLQPWLPDAPVLMTPMPANGHFWYQYQEDFPSKKVVDDLLYPWQTAGRSGGYRIYMEVWNTATNQIFPLTQWVYVTLNNAAPALPTIEITAGSGKCGDFFVGDPVFGTYEALEPFCGSISVDLLPTNAPQVYMVSPPLATPTAAAIQAAGQAPPRVYTNLPGGVPTGGEAGNWLVTTTGLPKCGYVVEVWMADRTIWSSAYVGRSTRGVVGFCLRTPGP